MDILANSGDNFIRNIAISFALASAVIVYLKIRDWFSKRRKRKTLTSVQSTEQHNKKGVANQNKNSRQ